MKSNREWETRKSIQVIAMIVLGIVLVSPCLSQASTYNFHVETSNEPRTIVSNNENIVTIRAFWIANRFIEDFNVRDSITVDEIEVLYGEANVLSVSSFRPPFPLEDGQWSYLDYFYLAQYFGTNGLGNDRATDCTGHIPLYMSEAARVAENGWVYSIDITLEILALETPLYFDGTTRPNRAQVYIAADKNALSLEGRVYTGAGQSSIEPLEFSRLCTGFIASDNILGLPLSDDYFDAAIVEETQEQIADFMIERGKILLNNRPDLASLVDAPMSSAPDASGQFTVTKDSLTFLTGKRSLSGKGDYSTWFDLTYTRTKSDNKEQQSLHFQLGSHKQINDSLYLGGLVEIDYSEEEGSSISDVSGHGFLAGPYFVWVLAEQRGYLEGHVGIGNSWNSISPFGLSAWYSLNPYSRYENEFKTKRLVGHLRYSARYELDEFVLIPEIGVNYFTETQQAYTDSNNLEIPEQTIEVGEFESGLITKYRKDLSRDRHMLYTLGLIGVNVFTVTNSELTAIKNGSTYFRTVIELTYNTGSFDLSSQLSWNGLGLNDYSSLSASVVGNFTF